MSYTILRTDKASDQLNNIINYIADDSDSVESALNYLNKIENAVSKLSEFPRIGHVPRYSILKKQGFLVLVIEKHLVFYKVDDIKKIVIIYGFFDSRQDYLNLI